MSDQPETSNSRSSSLKVSLWFLIIPVLYVLSVGPASKIDQVFQLHRTCRPLATALEYFYAPLTLLADHSPAFAVGMFWYMGAIWRVEGGEL